MSEFNCTSPWGTNKDHICTNETIGFLAHNMYLDYFYHQNATRAKIFCPKSCHLMELRSGNERRQLQRTINGKRSGTITFKLNEIFTVSNDQYTYLWLNFIAEVGGYVGLFLGYSVYHITDALDIILPDKISE